MYYKLLLANFIGPKQPSLIKYSKSPKISFMLLAHPWTKSKGVSEFSHSSESNNKSSDWIVSRQVHLSNYGLS